MFGGGRKSSHGPIGVDVGDHTIRMIQFIRDSDRVIATAAASRTLGHRTTEATDIDQVAAAIKDMLSSGQFKGNHVVSCLPAAKLLYKNIRLPKMPYDELASAVQWEATERLKFSGEAMDVQFIDAGEVLQGQEQRHEVILLAAARSFIEEHIEAFRSCDLELLAIEAVPSALARCIGQALPDDEDDLPVRVVIDVGYNGTKVLMTRGARICFFKHIEIGGRHMDEALASKLQLPTSAAAEARREWLHNQLESSQDAQISSAMGPIIEDLSREIGLCLRYYSVTFRGRRPEEAWVVGGESSNTWLWVRLCEDVGLKPTTNDPLSNLDLSAVHSEVGGPDNWAGWGVAIGLALRDCDILKKRKRKGAA